MLLLIVVGLIIRVILMPICLHPDIWAISFAEYFFAFKGVTNIYDYLAGLAPTVALTKNYGQNFFTYPPLSYFTLGIFGLLIRPFVNISFWQNLAVNLPNILEDNRLFWHLFLTKLPYLFFDGGILILLTKLFAEEKKKKLVVILWLFNPLVLYTTYMIGQFDIIPVFFTVLALYLAKEKKLAWAALALGVGGAYKMFPLFFLPFLVVSQTGKIRDKLMLLLVGLLPYLLTILPFLGSLAFRQTVLFSEQTQKMLFAGISVSGAEYLSLFVVGYVLFLFLAIFKKIELWRSFTLVMLLFFSVTHFHPQWFLWITPFLIIFIIEHPKLEFLPLSLLICWLIITLLFEPSLSVGLFAPLSHSLVQTVPLSTTIARFYDVFQLKSLVRSVFAGVSLATVILLLKDDQKTA